MQKKTGTARSRLSSLRNVCINNLMRNIVEKSLIHKTVLVLIAFLLIAGSPSNASNSGPEIMELKSPAGNKAARFPHKKHQNSFACKECHHTRAEDSVQSPYVEGMQIKKCIGCHNADDTTVSNWLPTGYAKSAISKTKMQPQQNVPGATSNNRD
jgi:cytochrome c553